MSRTQELFDRRAKRVRFLLRQNNPSALRLSVFRSNNHISAQIIDDARGHTVVAASSLDKGIDLNDRKSINVAIARQVGQLLAEKAKAAQVDAVFFDRGGYLYHGRVKALAEGARDGGLKF
jgi:large subunit ribosomal protein L18